MMAHKHLHELLNEDQEPFLLENYIADRRSQIKRPIPKTRLQAKKLKAIVDSSTSKRSLCKQACFFSFHDSPDVRKSPFLDFPWPASTAKSPCKSPNAVLLHVPARTAALLLEAAVRIQKQSSSSKPKNQIKNVGYGLFGSILKRLSGKNRSRKREIGGDGGRLSAGKSAGKSEKVLENVVDVDDRSAFEMGFACSRSNSRRHSAVWSESNEEKSLDLETSSSCRSEDSEEIESAVEEREIGAFAFCEKHFCSSPLSPYLFALQKSPSTGRRTPNFSSPATSPSRHNKQEENCEVESMQKVQLEEEEEEKEQCSPVSVLEPPFEDDDDRHEDGGDEDGYDLECSYATVQRAKLQLLQKLCRFEKLAELDPVELEKRMLEEQEDEDEVQECEDDDDSLELYGQENVDGFVREVLDKSGLHLGEVSADMKRLVLDLIGEEKREEDGIDDNEVVAKRVCKTLDSWKDVESNTIDMMVDLDFRRELDGWKRNDQEQVGETAKEIELAIFGLLVEELSE